MLAATGVDTSGAVGVRGAARRSRGGAIPGGSVERGAAGVCVDAGAAGRSGAFAVAETAGVPDAVLGVRGLIRGSSTGGGPGGGVMLREYALAGETGCGAEGVGETPGRLGSRGLIRRSRTGGGPGGGVMLCG